MSALPVAKVERRAVVVRRTSAPPRRGTGELGLDPHELALVTRILDAPRGLVLVAGPARSGKSTTAAAMCAAVTARAGKLPTGIDAIDGAAAAARAAELAHDHLVFATIEAADGTDALGRLAELGVDASAAARVLTGAIVQRMARKLCAFCTHRYDPPAMELGLLGIESIPPGALFARGLGCGRCGGSGRAGSVPAFELLFRPSDGAAERAPLARSVLSRLLGGIISTEEAIAIVDGTR